MKVIVKLILTIVLLPVVIVRSIWLGIKYVCLYAYESAEELYDEINGTEIM